MQQEEVSKRERDQQERELDQKVAEANEAKVRALFHRLDIPLEDIPVSSLLPWQSFAPLLEGHFGKGGVSRKAPAAAAAGASASPAPAPSGILVAPSASWPASRTAETPSGSSRVKQALHSSVSLSTQHHQQLLQQQHNSSSVSKGHTTHTKSRGGLSPRGKPSSSCGASSSAGIAASPSTKSVADGGGGGALGIDHSAISTYNHSQHNLADLHNSSSASVTSHAALLTAGSGVIESRDYNTIETTLEDMHLVTRRIKAITSALNTGKQFRRITGTSIEEHPMLDPELRLIKDLQRQLLVSASELHGHATHVLRMQETLREKDALIASLYRELDRHREWQVDLEASGGSASGDYGSMVAPAGFRGDDGPLGRSPDDPGSVDGLRSPSATTTPLVTPLRPLATTLSFGPPALDGAARRGVSPLAWPREGDGGFSPAGATTSGSKQRHHARQAAVPALDAASHRTLAVLGDGIRQRLAAATQMYKTHLVAAPAAGAGKEDGKHAPPPPPPPLSADEAAALADVFALLPALRLVPPPTFALHRPLQPTIAYLAINIPLCGPQSTETPLDPAIWSSLLSQSYHFFEALVARHGGVFICPLHGKQTAIFADPLRAVMAALDIQLELPLTSSVAYPSSILDTALETVRNSNTSATAPKYIWRGFRPVVAIDLSTTAAETSFRDVCGSGAVIYSGIEVDRTRYLAQHTPYGGAILCSQAMARFVDTNAIELDEPLVAFWQWTMLPGLAAPVPIHALYHRSHHTRQVDLHQSMRYHYTDFQYAVLTDQDTPAALDRLVAVNNRHAVRHGVKPATKDDESILGVEGATVEARLQVLRTIHVPAAVAAFVTAAAALPPETPGGVIPEGSVMNSMYSGTFGASSTAAAVVNVGNVTEVFLARIPAVVDTVSEEVPVGDQTLILVSLPCYPAIVGVLDDAAAQQIFRRVAKVVRDTADEFTAAAVAAAVAMEKSSMFASSSSSFAPSTAAVVEVRGGREKILFACSDPVVALKFCFTCQLRLLQVAWQKDMPEVAAMLSREFRVRQRVVDAGPATAFSLHFTKVTPATDTSGDGMVYYPGPEVEQLLLLVAAAPESVASIVISEVVFGMVRYRLDELDDPFIEPAGLITHPTASPDASVLPSVSSSGASSAGETSPLPLLRPCYAVTPKGLIGRCAICPVALWTLARDRWHHKYGSQIARMTVAMTVKAMGDRFALPTLASRPLQTALQTALLQQRAALRETAGGGGMAASVHCLTSSTTITATRTQAVAVQTYFDWSKVRSQIEGVQVSLVQMVEHRRDAEPPNVLQALEITEASLMQLFDRAVPSVVPLAPPVPAELHTLVELLNVMQGKGARLKRDSVVGDSCGPGGLPRGRSAILRRRLSQAVMGGAQQLPNFAAPATMALATVKLQNMATTAATNQSHSSVNFSSSSTIPASPSAGGRAAGTDAAPFVGSISLMQKQYVSGSEALAILEIDKERMFLMRRSKAMETEVVVTHMVAQHFHTAIKAYMQSILDGTKALVPSEVVVVKLVQKILAARVRQKRLMGDYDEDHAEASSDGSAESELESDDDDDSAGTGKFVIHNAHINLSAVWADILTQRVELKDSEQFDYDPILLCRSLVAQLAHQFLFLRGIASRLSRNAEQLDQLRTMDPSATKMGKALVGAAEAFRQQRKGEMEALRAAAASVLPLPHVKE